MRPPEWDINNVMRQVQLHEFGSLVFKIYEEQYEDIRDAYESYECADAPFDIEVAHGAYHRFFKAFYKAVEKRDAEQAERKKQMDKEHEDLMERVRKFEPLTVEELNDLFGGSKNE